MQPPPRSFIDGCFVDSSSIVDCFIDDCFIDGSIDGRFIDHTEMTSCQSSFLIHGASIPVSIVFDTSVLPYLDQADRDMLQLNLSSSETILSLSKFSLEFRRCLYAICGADSADLLQVDPASCSRKCLNLDHLEERPVNFFLRHISDMPPWTKGKANKGSTGDHVIVERVLGPPYLQGDHMASNPKGALDFAVSAMLRDSVWIDDCLGFVSQEYIWDKLYLAEAAAYRHCLYNTSRFGMGDDPRTYAETDTKYKATASFQFRALKEIGDLHQNKSIALVGPNNTLLRPGMGAVVDPPLQERAQAANVEAVYGTVLEIDTSSSHVKIRLLLGRDNLPEYVIGKLGPNELLQTNATLIVPFSWVSGTFRLWPPQLFQADCIPQDSEFDRACKFLSRIVVCDLEISMDGEKDRGEITVSFDIFPKLLQGQLRLTLSRLKPFPAPAALAYLYHMHELEGGLNPPAYAYRCLMGHTLEAFALKKAEHARSAKDQLSFRPDMPGCALMELLYRVVKPEERNIAIRNGNLTVEVKNLDALHMVFGLNPSRFDLRGNGLGVIEFHGPFVFKWSMYDTLDPSGPLSGSVSISVGSYTEYCRMGTDVIKSSKCHPDALRGSGIAAPLDPSGPLSGSVRISVGSYTEYFSLGTDVIKSSKCHPDALRGSGIKTPVEKRARASKSSSDTGRMKHVSKAPAQAMERMQRQVKRMALLPSGSGSESTSTSDERDVRRSTSQPPYCSDSQSGGELPAEISEAPGD